MPVARVYLTGQLAIETPGGLADLRALPGRQGRRAFVYLVGERSRPDAHSDWPRPSGALSRPSLRTPR